jgi:hypothetical protein
MSLSDTIVMSEQAAEKQGSPATDEEQNANSRNTNHLGAEVHNQPEELPLSNTEALQAGKPLGEQELLVQTSVEREAYPFYRSPPSIDLCKTHQQASRCDNEYNFLSIDDQHSRLG